MIYQSIKDKKHKKNTLIYLSDKESKSKFYIPVIFTVALNSFADNWTDNETEFEIGDIVQKGKNRYKIETIDNKIKLTKQDEYSTTIFIDKEKINQYILTTANLQNHHVRKQFEMYKKFFADILYLSKQGKNNIELPSKFKYKSIIITDKKIETELKQYKIGNDAIQKAFPFRYITKTGTIRDNLPIAPMLYIVNDYQTARTHILDKNIDIRNLVFIGATKYKDYLLEISEDLNNKRIENALFIGSADIENNAIPELQKWKWTLTELNKFNYFETYKIKTIKVENENFSKLLQEFNNIIKQIENEHGLDLKELYKYARNILPIVIPNSDSRLIKQLENLLIYFEKEGLDVIETEFYKIDEWEFEDIWTEILEKFKEIINYQKKTTSNMRKYKNLTRLII